MKIDKIFFILFLTAGAVLGVILSGMLEIKHPGKSAAVLGVTLTWFFGMIYIIEKEQIEGN
jgi:hypothetical protein